jgi:uncharacterized membrane protein
VASYLIDWLGLIARWLHIVAGAAWIGTSFYFVWLNNHLRRPEVERDGVEGALWAIHGGGFYEVSKHRLEPGRLPKTLHWFKWEAYVTWMSGIALLVLVYYLNASTYMVDPQVSSLSPGAAVGFGAGMLVLGLAVYELLCRSPLLRWPLLFAAVAFALATGAAWTFASHLGARAAYIHVGAMLGTIMAGNVFLVIIPYQKKCVRAAEAGKEVDQAVAKRAALRSLHNNYITLPVLFIMVSNHYPLTYQHPYGWAILAAIALIGAGVRHWFNLRGQGKKNVWLLPAAAVAMIALAVAVAPEPPPEPVAGPPDTTRIAFPIVQAIIQERCITCHSATPTHPDHSAPPQGIAYDSPAEIRARADRIKAVAVDSPAMPLGNATGMTPEERTILGRWIDEGAPIPSE